MGGTSLWAASLSYVGQALRGASTNRLGSVPQGSSLKPPRFRLCHVASATFRAYLNLGEDINIHTATLPRGDQLMAYTAPARCAEGRWTLRWSVLRPQGVRRN